MVELFPIGTWPLLVPLKEEEVKETPEEDESEENGEGLGLGEEECGATVSRRKDLEEAKAPAEKKEQPKPELKDITKMTLQEKTEYINKLEPQLRPMGRVLCILASPAKTEFTVGLAERKKKMEEERKGPRSQQRTGGGRFEDVYSEYDAELSLTGRFKKLSFRQRKEEGKEEPVGRYVQPLTKCYIKMRVANPELFVESPMEYYLCQYDDWNINDLFPTGRIVKTIGTAGTIPGETNRVLAQYKVFSIDFAPETLEELKPIKDAVKPETQDVIISEEELKRRRDLRNKRIFTVDNDDTRDIDDAIHVEKVSEGVYEMGVHIADVGHYVKPGMLVDKEARDKATSVYFVHKVYPMLPEILTNNVCSLNPNVDRLAFSVIFRVDASGMLIKEFTPQMFKSIIRSRSKMAYSVMQGIMEHKLKSNEELPVDHKIFSTLSRARPCGRLHLRGVQGRLHPDKHADAEEAQVEVPGRRLYHVRQEAIQVHS